MAKAAPWSARLCAAGDCVHSHDTRDFLDEIHLAREVRAERGRHPAVRCFRETEAGENRIDARFLDQRAGEGAQLGEFDLALQRELRHDLSLQHHARDAATERDGDEGHQAQRDKAATFIGMGPSGV